MEAENEIVGPTYETNGLRVILTRHSCNHRSRNTILRIARTYIPVRAPIVALNHPTIFSPLLSFFFFLFSFFFFLVRCIIKSPLYTIWLHIVGIFFVLILETKWKIKSLQFYPKWKSVSALHEHCLYRTRVFVSNLTKSFSQRMTPISRFLAKHIETQSSNTAYSPEQFEQFFERGKKRNERNNSLVLVLFSFLFLLSLFFFLFQTIKTRIR